MSPSHTSRPDGGSLLPGDDPWAGYVRIAVEISRSPCHLLVVRAAPDGQAGTWPWPDTRPVHVMTAWDPGDERPGIAANRRRQAALEEELRRSAEATPFSIWSASGCDSETGYRDEGVAVSGMPEAAARALGARYRQEAIFSWSPREWAIVACTGARRVSFGWSIESLEVVRPP